MSANLTEEPIVVLGEASESEESEWSESMGETDQEPDELSSIMGSQPNVHVQQSRDDHHRTSTRAEANTLTRTDRKASVNSTSSDDLLSRKLRERNTNLRSELVHIKRNTHIEALNRLQRMQNQIVRQQKVLNEVTLNGRSNIDRLQKSLIIIDRLQQSMHSHLPKFSLTSQ